ncbi:MAG: glutamate synthase subunit beta [Candidatus Omnitrophota bacterium]
MGDIKGFIKVKRKTIKYRPVRERVKDHKEVIILPQEKHSQEQASRCMDCGTPFCHWACPAGNLIPEWNDWLFKGNIKKAYELLSSVNDFPEITGRICPALCEYACVLGLDNEAVTIRENELLIVEEAFKRGIVRAVQPLTRTGKKAAIIGSGPAGLACAVQLNRAGHKVTVYEKDPKPGGILRYGIPDFKLEKRIIDRRIKLMKKQGIEFVSSVKVGTDINIDRLEPQFDVVCLACGSNIPRDLKIPGRSLKGVYFAMEYLVQANKAVSGEKVLKQDLINAHNKRVVVIGGGDTGSDCVGTSHRQKALSVTQIELMPKPPQIRDADNHPWPMYPVILKESSSHKEGGKRIWSVNTKEFAGQNGNVKKLICSKVEFVKQEKNSPPVMKEISGSEFEIEADLVIIAAGFVHPEHKGMVDGSGIELDDRGNVKTDENQITSRKSWFSCGDMNTGQSLVVKAMYSGRRTAHCIDKYLMGRSYLPE